MASILDDAIMDPNQEVSFKIKPLMAAQQQGGAPSAISGGGSTPAAGVGGGGTSPIQMPFGTMDMGLTTNPTATPFDPNNSRLQSGPASSLLSGAPERGAVGGGGQQGGMMWPAQAGATPGGGQPPLTPNPQLVTHPLGAQTDSIYEAAIAELNGNIQNQYADILQQLGFVGPDGQFIPGLLETAAARQRDILQQGQEFARQGVTDSATRGGTLFSGRRGYLQGRAEDPFVRQRGELESALGMQLGDRYQEAMRLLSGFNLQRDKLIADAAARAAARIQNNPVGEAAPPADPGTGEAPGREGLPGPMAGNLTGETDWQRAERLRSEALNKRYGLGDYAPQTGGGRAYTEEPGPYIPIPNAQYAFNPGPGQLDLAGAYRRALLDLDWTG